MRERMTEHMTVDAAVEFLEHSSHELRNPSIRGYVHPGVGGVHVEDGYARLIAQAQAVGAKALKQWREELSEVKPEKIYISGKMKGLTQEQIDLNFGKVEHYLRMNEYDVINPSKVHIEGLEYEELLQVDFRLIDLCDGIIMLENWVDSEGAAREKAYAIATGKPVYRMADGGKIFKEV